MRVGPGLVAAALTLLAACAPDAATRLDPEPSGAAFAKGGPGGAGAMLELCKVGGTGISTGTPFDFTVTRAGVARAVTIGAGTCAGIEVPLLSAALGKGAYRSRPVLIHGLLPNGSTLAIGGTALDADAISAILANAVDVEVSSPMLLNLVQQLIAARLNVLQGISPSPEVLQAILDADAAMDVAAGPPIVLTTALVPPQMSSLVDALSTFNEGTTGSPTSSAILEIEEMVPASMVATIACAPVDACSNADPAAGSVTATIEAGASARVEFTNTLVPTLTVCKVAGPGIVAGTPYDFIYAVPTPGGGPGGRMTIQAGGCEDLFLDPNFEYQVAETLPENTVVSSIVCDPAARCSSADPDQLSAFMNLVAGSNTTVTFTNRSTLGTLRVCKAGSGVLPGTMFRFEVFNTHAGPGNTEFSVAVGHCVDLLLPEGNFQVDEDVPPNMVVTAITCQPEERCGGSVSLEHGFGFVDIAGGMTTTMTFTNDGNPVTGSSIDAPAKSSVLRRTGGF